MLLQSDRETRLHSLIENFYPKYSDFLSRLVRIPSPIGSEAAAQRFVAAAMKDLGLAVDFFEIDPERLKGRDGFVRDERNYKGRPLVVGKLAASGSTIRHESWRIRSPQYRAYPQNRSSRGTGGRARSLILNAHVDTAPLGDRDDWSFDPLAGEIRDGKLWGRGAWDDKAGIAIMLLIAEALRAAEISIQGDLILQSVIEDEASGNGTLACLARGPAADGAIILDGTWAERIIDSHMGQTWFTVEVAGRSAPACVSSRGENPVLHLAPILKAFERFAEQKNNELKQPWGSAARPFFINVGKISGGHWPGSVPAKCKLECQLGFCPPATLEEIQKEIKQRIGASAQEDAWLRENPPKIIFWGLQTDPVLGIPANPVIKGIGDAVKRLRDKNVQVTPVTGHADLRHFYHHPPPIPACLYGPGEGKNAHVENEYYVLDQMIVVAQNIASFILDWWQGP